MLAACLALAPANAAGQQKSVLTDVLTGVALSGYDPVAYFTEGAPRQGSSLYDLEWNGAVWYFSSAANRDAFASAPDVYAPLFGGHCVMSMARGYTSDGNPQLFAIVADRLVLFHSTGNRAAFHMAPAPAVAQAQAHWDALPDWSAAGG